MDGTPLSALVGQNLSKALGQLCEVLITLGLTGEECPDKRDVHSKVCQSQTFFPDLYTLLIYIPFS